METESRSVNENEPRRRPGVERVYQNSKIAVLWEPKLCIHAGYCFRGLPEVFQPESRPWVKVDAATGDKIAEIVITCPTGRVALRAARWRSPGATTGGNNNRHASQWSTLRAGKNANYRTWRSTDPGRHAPCVMQVWSFREQTVL
jgi:uncharacterized Fe-S cluster protein YjdI